MVTGLKVSKNIHDEGVRWLILPATYTRETLHADVEEVVTLEKARTWEHLKIIAYKLLREANMEIGLLIGANYSKALEPEVLPSKDGGHFAFRTPLGWCVDGPLTKIGKESSIPCTQIVVQDAATGKIASHHFGISSKAKDINSKQMLENIYNTEFCESRLGFGIEVSNNMEDFSFEDQKTLKLMDEKSRKVGKHFEIHLPLKNSKTSKQ